MCEEGIVSFVHFLVLSSITRFQGILSSFQIWEKSAVVGRFGILEGCPESDQFKYVWMLL